MSDHSLQDDLKACDAGQIPSPFGEMELVVLGSPASVQSTKHVKDTYLASIKAQIAQFKFLLTGELMLDVIWLLPAKSRFETDAKADIDNCIKPIIDAFTGPDGLFVDDCQLKGLYICWRHIESGDERLHFQFKFHPEDFADKDGFAFLRLEKNLCTHVSTLWPLPLRVGWVALMKTNQLTKGALEKLGASYLPGASLLGGRPFHISRVQSFPVFKTAGEFLK